MVKKVLYLKKAYSRFKFATIFTICWIISSSLVSFCNPLFSHFSQTCSVMLPYFKLLSKTFTLSIPLFITFQLVSEKYTFNFPKIIMYFFGFVCLLLYFMDGFLLNKVVLDNVYFQQQFYLYFLLLILLLSFASFFKTSMHSFWKFNNILFIKLIRISVWSLLCILIFASLLFLLDKFFVQDVSFFFYEIGMIIIVGYVGSLYFLTQIPTNLDALEEDTPYPKFYYLISSLYFLPTSIFFILCSYIYFIVMLLFNWSFFIEITIFTLLGIGFGLFFLIQMELLRTRTSNRFTLFFLKYFYGFILPITLLNLGYLTSHWFKSGITEFWYMCWILLFWVVIVCVYFIYSRRKDIRLIPMSLFILSFVVITGPFMPFNMACQSQLYQLKKVLIAEDMFENQKIQFKQDKVMLADNELKVKNIITFLNEHNRLRLLKKIYPYTIASESLTLRRVMYDFNFN